MKGDLHLHSYYSDGFYSPAEVMAKAAEAGCQAVALTDHDSISGIAEAKRKAEQLNITFINGVELSCYLDMEVHILGYGVRADSDELNGFIAEQKKARRTRSQKLLEKLRDNGIDIPESELTGAVPREISRTHIASAMVKLGYEPDFFTAMNKWLRYGAPTYVAHRGAEPSAAIRKIHAAGGRAVLAHPVRLAMTPCEKERFVNYLADCGLDGIEAVYKRSPQADQDGFKAMADRYGLFVTSGADFHGDGNEIIARELGGRTSHIMEELAASQNGGGN